MRWTNQTLKLCSKLNFIKPKLLNPEGGWGLTLPNLAWAPDRKTDRERQKGREKERQKGERERERERDRDREKERQKLKDR